MQLPCSQVLVVFATILICRAEDTPKNNEIKKESDVVYLIDTLDDTKLAKDKSGKPHEASYELVDPIPFDQAGDGVYFRPANGEPLAKPQVKDYHKFKNYLEEE